MWSTPIAFRKLLQANPRAIEKRRASADDVHGQVPTLSRHALGLREPS
jgi:hypothetical protein